MLARAHGVAAACGITRLADVTHLQPFGVPVWQAVRPMSRSLSVHQGKGFTHAAAQIGALMEGIECHHAEQFVAEDFTATAAEARSRHGVQHVDDFLTHRDRTLDPDIALAWTRLQPLGDSAALVVPSLWASLDFTRDTTSVIERNSNGLASGACVTDALLSALCEMLERDAWARARHWSGGVRASRSLDLAAVPLGWLQPLLAHVHALGFALLAWDITSWCGLPCVQARLCDLSATSMTDVPATEGWCCHPRKENALAGAILEAIQSRLTSVAGARDDIEDWDDRVKVNSNLFAALEGLMPVGIARHGWDEVADSAAASPAGWLELLLARLAAAGFDQIGYLDLAQPEIGIPVVKLCVPGLGLDNRAPRLPA